MLLNLAYSPCPNDTYTYYGIYSGKVFLKDDQIKVHHHDIETLNQYAFEERYEITKMSFYTWLKLKNKYRLLKAGNALGFGCGPIIISAKKNIKPEDLLNLRIALPGELTTANLLFSLYSPQSQNKIFTRYDDIFSAIKSGRADCGVVIHESRFLFEKEGLYKVCDLGEWWEEKTGAPIPLGAVGIRSDLPQELDLLVENAIRESLEFSKNDISLAIPYIREKAIELDDNIINQHIKTFVNEFTYDLGEIGMDAVRKLEEMGAPQPPKGGEGDVSGGAVLKSPLGALA